jgi:hypothetical protein
MHSKRILLAVIALCVITLCTIGTLAQQGTDCRRRKEPTEGSLDLTGEWMDNSVNLKVKITQDGTDILSQNDIPDKFAIVRAKYLVPYKCAQSSDDGQAVLLDGDFNGQLSKKNLGAHPEITGAVFICQDVRGPNNTIYSERVQGEMTLTVSQDANSMTGSFEDPAKGTQNISFTRLSKTETPPVYAPQSVIKTTTTAKIYQEPSIDSRVRYTAPPGTQLIFENSYTKLDADGNPTWYWVTNGEGPEGSKNTGWIQATQITCAKPNTKAPGKIG